MNCRASVLSTATSAPPPAPASVGMAETVGPWDASASVAADAEGVSGMLELTPLLVLRGGGGGELHLQGDLRPAGNGQQHVSLWLLQSCGQVRLEPWAPLPWCKAVTHAAARARKAGVLGPTPFVGKWGHVRGWRAPRQN